MRRLLIRPGAIGDFLVSLPALEHLRADYTEVWCAQPNVPLARFADHSRSIIGAGLDRVAILPAEDCLERLRGFDEIHSWYGTRREDFRDAVRSLPFRFYEALPTVPGMLATAFYCSQVGAPVRAPRLRVRAVERRRSVVLHPFASSPGKRWPLGHFRELATLLVPIVQSVEWCAGPEEPLAEAVRFNDLFELACWLSAAACYIGNDSGITHLAAAAGTPVIAIFGPTDPRIWAPITPKIQVIARMPLPSISPGEILWATQTLL